MAAPRKRTPDEGAGENGKPARAFLVVGEDDFRVGEKAGELVERLLGGADRQFALDVVEGRVERVDAAVQAVLACMAGAQTVPLFGGNRVVWLRDAVFLAEKARTQSQDDATDGQSDEPRSKPVREALSRLAEAIEAGLPDGTSLLVTAPAVGRRSPLFRAVERVGQVIAFERSDKPYLVKQEAGAFLDGQLRRAGIRMAGAVREMFLDRVGADSRCIAGEVAKLAVYLGGKPEAGGGDVDAVVSCTREAIWWDLTDAIGDGRLAAALGVLRQLLFQGVDPVFLAGRLFGHVKSLSVLRETLDRGWLTLDPSGRRAVWRELSADDSATLGRLTEDPRRLHPVRTAILARQAKRLSRERLDRNLRTVLLIRERLVRSSLPPKLVLEVGLVEMLA
jgi:DNA polymerase-3 subunit delta